MKEYKCETCSKLFKKKWDYDCHKNRKNPCKPAAPVNTEEHQNDTDIKVNDNMNNLNISTDTNTKTSTEYENEHKCSYCNKEFTRRWTLYRHINDRCEQKRIVDQEKEEIFKKLLNDMVEIKNENKEIKSENKEIKEKNKQLENKILLLERKSKTKNNNIKNNNINSNNTNNITNNNIKIVAYGKEDLTKLTEKEWLQILNRNYRSIEEFIKILHFDKNKPENHNVYVSNMRSNKIMIHDGQNWNMKDRKIELDEMYEDKAQIILDKFEIYKDKMQQSRVKNYDKIKDDYDTEKIKSVLLKDIEMLLYNKKDIPLATQKRLQEISIQLTRNEIEN